MRTEDGTRYVRGDDLRALDVNHAYQYLCRRIDEGWDVQYRNLKGHDGTIKFVIDHVIRVSEPQWLDALVDRRGS